jgi:hypothetical protein
MEYNDKKKLTPEILALSLFIGIGHNIFVQNNVYYLIPKLDMLMHTLGGVLIGLIFLKVFFVGKRFTYAQLHRGVVIWTTLIAVFIIGFGWEIFEYGVGLTPLSKLATLDTASDIMFDIAGALIAVWWYFKRIWKVG